MKTKNHDKIFFAALIVLVLLAFSLKAQAADIALAFRFDFTGYTICTSTVTTNCLEKFEVGVVSGGGVSNVVEIPVPASPSGSMTMSGTIVYANYGQVTVQAVTVAKDANGARVVSDPAKLTLAIPPKAPDNLNATVLQ